MKDYLEKYAFGVCLWLGQKLGIKATIVRVFFIYLSFVTAGSPILFYLIMAFWLRIKQNSFKRFPRIIY